MGELLIVALILIGTFPVGVFIIKAVFKKSILSTVANWFIVIIYLVSYTSYIVGTTDKSLMLYFLPLNFTVAAGILMYINKKLKIPLEMAINKIKDISAGKLNITVDSKMLNSLHELGILANRGLNTAKKAEKKWHKLYLKRKRPLI